MPLNMFRSYAVLPAVLSAAAVAFSHAQDAAPDAEPPAAQVPAPAVSAPIPPSHKGKNITTAAGLAEDLAEIMAYLEKGKAYYVSYQTGTHTVAENAEFLNFLEAYERELALAKKEVKMLQTWIDARGALDAKAP